MIALKSVSLRRGPKLVLERATVTLNAGEKVGLVGRNGAGKSSLFALLAGRLQPDAGDCDMPPSWRIAEVLQSMPEGSQAATDFVLDGDVPLREAEAALAEAEARDDGHAIADAHLALEHAGAFDARSRAQSLLLGLGFKPEQLDAAVDNLSGGWRMRLQLARALMSPAELLLLDEPTNHLDLDALVWLESWLQRHEGTLLIISHDREFLDAVTRTTLHIEDRQLTRWSGNYTAFEQARAAAQTLAQAAYEKQQERIAHLTRFIERFRAKATKAKQAQSRMKALDRMEKLAPVLTAADFSFEFREPASLPNPMLVLRDVACGYAAARPVLRGVDVTVLAGQRIGILGANGQGKSTLVKTIAREIDALSGTQTEGKGLAIGYFAQQEMDLLHADDTPMQHMTRLARRVSPDAREQELRNFLGQFAFGGDLAQQPVGTLSGGERARLVLASIVWQRANLLLLDEPTNHLDLTTREALSIALNEFEGTVLLVSHDRALLRETCDAFLLVAHGRVSPFDGDLDDYQRWLLDVSRATAKGQAAPPVPKPTVAVEGSATKPPAAAKAPPAPAAPAARKDERKQAAQARQELANRTRPLRLEIQQIDTRLEKLAAERSGLEAQLVDGRLDGSEIADTGRRLNHIAAEVAMLEERWLELQTEIESLAAGG